MALTLRQGPYAYVPASICKGLLWNCLLLFPSRLVWGQRIGQTIYPLLDFPSESAP